MITSRKEKKYIVNVIMDETPVCASNIFIIKIRLSVLYVLDLFYTSICTVLFFHHVFQIHYY